MGDPFPGVQLRPVAVDDLDILFEHQRDAHAVWMAAFTAPDPHDRDAFDQHWGRLMTSDDTVVRVIDVDGRVVGHIATFDMLGAREVTYWIDRACWGRGVASEAVRTILTIDSTRPLFARTASDNVGSGRVLKRNGFVPIGEGRAFATARNEEIDETVYRLD